MDSSTALSFSAVAISVAAVAISTAFAVRQVRLMRQANYLSALVDLLMQFRSKRFNDNFRYVCERLGDHDPSLGITGLPDDAREAVYDVAYYYHTFLSLATFGIVDRDLLIALLHYRIIAVWEAISPYVAQERKSGPGGPHVLKLLETFATSYAGRVEPNVEKLIQQQFRL